jgi:hypothetical protein
MEYLLKSAAVLTLFYGVYKIFLERETFFQSLRAYLLLGLASSLLLPGLKIREYIMVETVQLTQTQVQPGGVSGVYQASSPGLGDILTWIYLSGLVFFGVRFLIQLGSLYLFLRKRPKTKEGPYWIIPTNDDTAPFSFFRYIVYPHKRFEGHELEQVLAHEKAHSDQFHSLDILFSELICVVLWFNPVVWLYHKEVQKNLEFIADSNPNIIRNKRKSYEFLLLKTAQPAYQLALTSSFYQSLIKKRIQMLQKSKSNNIMYLKFGIILPLLAAFVLNFNTEIIAQQKSSSTKVIEIDEEMQVITKDFSKTDLDKLKANLLKQGIELKYKKLKYNDANEIIGIELTVSNNKGNKAKLSQSGAGPIAPISIRYDAKNGTLALGNMKGMHDVHVAVHTDHDGTIHKEIRKEIIIDKDGEKEVIIIGGDGDSHYSHEDVDVKVMSDGNVWISESGDSTKDKHIEVIEIDEDSPGATKIMIKKGEPGVEDIDVKIKTISGGHDGNDFVFLNEGDSKPLIIMDGKEVPDGKMEDLDHENIETIEVLKGSKAVEKYGDKARDGVVIITSKK